MVNKFLVALVGVAVTAITSALTDGDFTTPKLIQVGIAVATAAVVWITANVPTLIWAKTAAATVLGLLNLYASYLTGHTITQAEIWNLVVNALVIVGVYAIPNKPSPTNVTGVVAP